MALLVLKDTLEGLSQEEQDKINIYAIDLRKVMTTATECGEEDKAMSQLAISLVGLETAVAMGA
jgi:hypothetical protein